MARIVIDPITRIEGHLRIDVEVDGGSVKNAWASPEVIAPVGDAVNALQAGDEVFALFPSIHGHLPDRQFVAALYDDGRQTIVLDGPTAYEREIHDMDRLDRTTDRP